MPIHGAPWSLQDALGGGVGSASAPAPKPQQSLAQKQGEYPEYSAQAFDRNKGYVLPGQHNYNTSLNPQEEVAFRAWLTQNNVPFDPSQSVTDYDMRGYWKALQSGDPNAKGGVDPNDQKLHYPDYWKTPYHETFSKESQWADKAKAPYWTVDDKLVLPDGTVLYDDRAKRSASKEGDK